MWSSFIALTKISVPTHHFSKSKLKQQSIKYHSILSINISGTDYWSWEHLLWRTQNILTFNMSFNLINGVAWLGLMGTPFILLGRSLNWYLAFICLTSWCLGLQTCLRRKDKWSYLQQAALRCTVNGIGLIYLPVMINKLPLTNKRVLSFAVYISGCSIEIFCSKVILGQVWSMVNDALLPNLFSISFSVTMARKFVKFGWIKCRSISQKIPLWGQFLKIGNCHFWFWFERELPKNFNEGDLS